MLMQRTPRGEARRAFGLDPEEAGALWQAPDGEWVVVTRGHDAPFVLNNLTEWHDVVSDDQVELTADIEGRVSRRGQPVATDHPAWVVPREVRASALT